MCSKMMPQFAKTKKKLNFPENKRDRSRKKRSLSLYIKQKILYLSAIINLLTT